MQDFLVGDGDGHRSGNLQLERARAGAIAAAAGIVAAPTTAAAAPASSNSNEGVTTPAVDAPPDLKLKLKLSSLIGELAAYVEAAKRDFAVPFGEMRADDVPGGTRVDMRAYKDRFREGGPAFAQLVAPPSAADVRAQRSGEPVGERFVGRVTKVVGRLAHIEWSAGAAGDRAAVAAAVLGAFRPSRARADGAELELRTNNFDEEDLVLEEARLALEEAAAGLAEGAASTALRLLDGKRFHNLAAPFGAPAALEEITRRLNERQRHFERAG